MAAVITAVKFVMGNSVTSLCVMVFSGILVYGVSLYFTGEIKNEVGAIIRIIRPVRKTK